MAESLNRGSHGHGNRSRHGEGTSSDHLSALLAVPNTGAGSLHGVLAAESAGVTSSMSHRVTTNLRAVLADFDLLHDLTKRRTISRSVLSANTDLLSSFALQTE